MRRGAPPARARGRKRKQESSEEEEDEESEEEEEEGSDVSLKTTLILNIVVTCFILCIFRKQPKTHQSVRRVLDQLPSQLVDQNVSFHLRKKKHRLKKTQSPQKPPLKGN